MRDTKIKSRSQKSADTLKANTYDQVYKLHIEFLKNDISGIYLLSAHMIKSKRIINKTVAKWKPTNEQYLNRIWRSAKIKNPTK